MFFNRATDYSGLRTPIFHQQLCLVLIQQFFITVAYYIGDSENIEQMCNELDPPLNYLVDSNTPIMLS